MNYKEIRDNRLKRLLSAAGFGKQLLHYNSQKRWEDPAADEQNIIEECVHYLIQIVGNELGTVFSRGNVIRRYIQDISGFSQAFQEDIKLVLTYRAEYYSQTVLEYLLQQEAVVTSNANGHGQGIMTKLWHRMCLYRYQNLDSQGQISNRIESFKLIRCIFQRLHQETCNDILSGSHRTQWLKILVQAGNVPALRTMLNFLSQSQKQSFLIKSSILFMALDSTSTVDIINFVSSELSIDKWTGLLKQPNCSGHGWTVLHEVASQKKFDILQLLLQRDSSEVIPYALSCPEVLWELATFKCRKTTNACSSTIFHLLISDHRHDISL